MVSIKKISNYATCSSNNRVKLRWQPKLPMALNGLTKEVFQDDLKISDIAPLFKKEDILNKENDQTIVILSCLSEVFGRIIYKDIVSFIEKKISPYLFDVTENHNVQYFCLKMTENWEEQLNTV